MQDLQNLVPKNKTDVETAEKLFGYTYEQIKPIVPDLLEWIQDMNWPVAGPVSKYLETIGGHLTSNIIQILRGNDPCWKYWTLIVFGKQKSPDPILLEEIKALKFYASKMDIEEGVLAEVDEILKKNDRYS